ncbi:MAG: DNA polymerase I, partial [Deltaproteobacteria bacterium]|nr:DNA polymerase I [Deltaproteobacteria bacterium]
MTEKSRPTLYLVDGSNLVFRAYYGIRHLSASDGTPTNAVYGVTNMILRIIKDKEPTHIGFVLDAEGKNFRHELYPEYKANRPPPPEDLVVQFPLVHQAIEALSIPLVVVEGVEADDVMGTLAVKAVEDGFDVVIISGDKDMLQLVNDKISVYDTMKEVVYDREGVKAKLGVAPEQVIDLLALQGDSSDNIPGVRSIGPKTATKLLSEHKDLETLLAAAPSLPKSKMRERLIEEADQARLSQKLATIKLDVALDVGSTDLAFREPDQQVLDAFLAKMGFSNLRKKLIAKRSLDTSKYRTITKRPEFDQLLAKIKKTKECAIDLETTSLDAMRADIVGLSLCPVEGEASYIPVAHQGENLPEQLKLDDVLTALKPILTDASISFYGQNIKYDSVILANRHDIRLAKIACDAMLASYVLDPSRASHSMDNLSRDLLGHETITYTQVAGKGKQQVPFAEVAVDKAAAYAAEDADVTFRLCKLLLLRVDKEGLSKLFTEIELPLIPVLIDMELAGIRVDPDKLTQMSGELDIGIKKLTERIYLMAGREFNINSPAQLRVILFDEMGFDVKKKTKSGPSTDSSVLEELAAEHELPQEILNYRSLAKLKSTYVDVLPGMINPDSGCIHTRYNQTVTATGRLSSSDPNLQNIPIRTELGKRIREAFLASDGHVLLSADYSQVELRILAHLSGDKILLDAFQRGEDIHARTAARIFGVSMDMVDSNLRARAKAVNFGIIYGQGPYNLARQLHISRREAKEIIDSYLDRYPRVRDWVTTTHETARKDKMVKTMFGRRRYLPEIESRNHNVRSNAERIAQNTPIQGSAADIIKLAMIRIHQALAKEGLQARMVLQVHDELVFNVPEGEVDLLTRIVREKMESAARLKVPLTVDIS